MKKKKKLTKEEVRTLIQPTIDDLKSDFPEWDDAATERLVNMLLPYNEGRIRLICANIKKANLVNMVVSHRAKHGATTVISEKAKESLDAEVAEENKDNIIVKE